MKNKSFFFSEQARIRRRSLKKENGSAWETNRGFVMLVELAEVARALQDVRAPSSNIRTWVIQLQATLRSFLRQNVIPVSQRYTAAWSARQKNTGSVLGIRHLSGSKSSHDQIFANFLPLP